MIKNFLNILILLILSHCSLNSESKYWTENSSQNFYKKDILNKINLKSTDITSMTFEEYKLYLDIYTKNSSYPDINK